MCDCVCAYQNLVFLAHMLKLDMFSANVMLGRSIKNDFPHWSEGGALTS